MYLKEINCSLPNFKKIILKKGINFIIAELDNDENLTERDKTNSVGKTTILEIIKYCFGKKINSKPFKNALNFAGCTYSILIGDEKFDYYRISKSTDKKTYDVFNFKESSNLSLSKDDYFIWLQENILLTKNSFFSNPLNSFLRSDVTNPRPIDVDFNETVWNRNSRITTCLGLNLRDFYSFMEKVSSQKRTEDTISGSEDIKNNLFGYRNREEIIEEIENCERKLETILNQRKSLEFSDPKILNMIVEENIDSDNLKLENEKLKMEIVRINKIIEKNNIKNKKMIFDKKLFSEFEEIFKITARREIEKINEFHFLMLDNLNNYLLNDILEMKKIIESNNNKINNFSSKLTGNYNYSEIIAENIKSEGRITEKITGLKEISNKFYDEKIKNVPIDTVKEKITEINTPNLYQTIENFITSANNFFDTLFPKYKISLSWKFEDFKKEFGKVYGPTFKITAAEKGEARSHLQAILFDLALLIFGNINFFLIHDSKILDPIDRTDISILLNFLEKDKRINQYIILIRYDSLNYEDLTDTLKDNLDNSLKLSSSSKLFDFDF